MRGAVSCELMFLTCPSLRVRYALPSDMASTMNVTEMKERKAITRSIRVPIEGVCGGALGERREEEGGRERIFF